MALRAQSRCGIKALLSVYIYNGNQGNSVIYKGFINSWISAITSFADTVMTMFYADCLQGQKGGALAVNVCRESEHDWVLLPPTPQAVQQRTEEQKQKDMVFMAGQ